MGVKKRRRQQPPDDGQDLALLSPRERQRVQHAKDIGHVHDEPKAMTKGSYTRAEVKAQWAIIRRLFIQEYDDREIQRALEAEHHHLTLARIRKLKAQVAKKWEQEEEINTLTTRTRQLKRLHMARRRAYEGIPKRNKDGVAIPGEYVLKPDMLAVRGFESEIAKIEGNYEPVKLDVDMTARAAIVEIIQGMDEDDVKGLLGEPEIVEGKLAS